MKVFLCEKPSVGEAVAQGLGLTATAMGGAIVQGEIAVTWARGHILEELEPEDYDPKLKKWSLAALPIAPINWQVKVKESTRSQFHVIDRLIKFADTVVLATDYDREGEVIGRSILDYCKFKGKVTRIKVTSMDDISMKEALKNEVNGDLSLPIYYAGLGRQRGDWLVGMNLTRYFTLVAQSKGMQDVYSVGRVQTPTLNLIVVRDREIERFVSHPFYENQVTLDSHGIPFKAVWAPPLDVLDDDKHLCNKNIADAVAADLKGQTAIVVRKVCNTERSAPPLPLNMSAAQILASKKWGFSAKLTLEILQNLYEKHKLTTYPRTDCRYLKKEMRAEIPDTIQAILATDHSIQPLMEKLDLALESKAWDSAEITAHHAIIPTRAPGKLDTLSDDERKLYLLVRD
uniref:DNA topoisomerase n=1 Tax=Yersinia aldovae TaxID=29483 RepID=UPI0021BDE6AB